ncbi:MAG TPA: hypothetical protein VKJ83_02450, partial [Actinomycetota bacterium]|nr:hypothetical protein [Actinomycetota bacterium]
SARTADCRPGWIRSGRTEDQALDALAAAARRYAPVAALAGLALPETARGAPRGAGSTRAGLEVVERISGNAATDFGVPAAIPEADRRPLTSKQARRVADLVGACWTYLDRVVAAAPAELRKGPRGGGRDRDSVFAHVIAAEAAYAGKLGIRRRDLPLDEAGPGSVVRAALLGVLGAASTGEPLQAKGPEAPLKAPDRKWPPRYAARRIAWHALDHAWEIEDRVP